MTLPKLTVPVLVVVALLGGYFLRSAFTQPTTAVTINSSAGKKLECIVDGVKCKGTAGFFTSRYDGVAGINAIETFATEHRVIIDYDPDLITPEQIRAIMNAPVEFTDGTHRTVFQCVSMKEM